MNLMPKAKLGMKPKLPGSQKPYPMPIIGKLPRFSSKYRSIKKTKEVNPTYNTY